MSDARVVRRGSGSRIAVLGGVACGLLVADTAQARQPLPTVEVVQPKRRVRLLDVRGPVHFGWGWSNLYRAPAYSMSFSAQASFVELSDTTWLHATFGESGVVSAVADPQTGDHPGFLGLDMGMGLSRYAPRGPAFVLDVTAGPRWGSGRPDEWQPNGVGVQGMAQVYPFFQTVPEIVAGERRWFRRYVLSGFDVWVSARWDWVQARKANTYAAGIGLDLGRSVMLPVLQAVERRRR